MKKIEAANSILKERRMNLPSGQAVNIFSPVNIALCKYWGKRDQELNLPVTGSLSVSLGNKGTTTTLTINKTHRDTAKINDQTILPESAFGKRLTEFLDLFRTENARYFDLIIQTNVPIAAGLASSASGFASLVQALNQLFSWDLSTKELSILARLGSGSASRSIESGFVEWHQGVYADGRDSFSERLPFSWPELCVGLLIVNEREKSVSSREAMQRTVATSPLYAAWPEKVSTDLFAIKQAIAAKDFDLLGKTAESNASMMHATMRASSPPIDYASAETLFAMQKIMQLRAAGLSLYFTRDAGPNLKLLFLQDKLSAVRDYFADIEIIQPFGFAA